MTVLFKTCRIKNLCLFLSILQVFQMRKTLLKMNFVNMKKLT